MNRPFILGLSGAAIVGAAIGLTYVVDGEPGEETAAVLKAPERVADPPVSDKQRTPDSPSHNATVLPTPDHGTSKPVSDPTQSSVSARLKNSANIATENSETSDRVTPRKPAFVVPQKPAFVAPRDTASVTPRKPTVVAPRKRAFVTPQDTASVTPQKPTFVAPRRPAFVTPRYTSSAIPQKPAFVTPRKSAFIAPRKPTFDVVRVNPRGDAVIAGRASPNAAVIVRDGQKEVGKATADARGEWVVIPKVPLPTGSRELTLSALTSDGTATRSDRNVVIVVPGPRPRNASKSKTNRSSGALAVLVPRRGKAGSVVMQKPSAPNRASSDAAAAGTRATAPVSIEAVDYDEAGNVTISGNATPRAPLSVYIDNRHAASGVSDSQGRWRVVPGGELAPGNYTLRVDNVGSGGKVIGRAETQFVRAGPVEAVLSNPVVSVEPGNSLWRIARRVYGSGIQYTVIFAANREQIRDPDLIYPGQVFFVPHVN